MKIGSRLPNPIAFRQKLDLKVKDTKGKNIRRCSEYLKCRTKVGCRSDQQNRLACRDSGQFAQPVSVGTHAPIAS
ncbi:hypothetical protein AA2016_6129 (plasmid) [Aminobacter aminovorans]|uniref:Uncharacterized protein n=1 Tax=Aminobacter aminovorans TaxID=83263 RepID=A0AAC9FEP5_AMIAI|nr:hypothetical protein AA2016_6129 [Aminobacter aminovorans]